MLRSLSLACLLALVPSLLRAEATLVFQGRSHPIKEQAIKGDRYYSLDSIAQALGAEVRVTGRKPKSIVIEYQGRTAMLTTKKSLASADGIIIDLRSPVEEVRNEIYVPETFLMSALGRLLESRVVYQPEASTFTVTSEKAVDVSIDYRSFPDHTRVVFRASERVPYTIVNPPGRLILRLNVEGVRCPTDAVTVEDGAVKSVTFKGGEERGTFVIQLGGSFKDFRTSEFFDPFRILVDIGRRDRLEVKETPGEEVKPQPTPTRAGAPLPTPTPETGPRPFRTIVLDPGHGGDESGAKGPTGLLEKNVTLDVARILKRILENNLGLQVMLTREQDLQMGLADRTAFANFNKADLFLSLHCNASPRANARGAETYFHSYQPTDADAKGLALRENYPEGEPGETRPGGDLELILWDMAQAEYIKESESFAEVVNFELCQTLDIKDRGVKQAPFAVLGGAGMPAVLVEMAFISNPEEEKALKTDDFKVKLATALYKAILRFKNSHDLKRGFMEP